MLDIEDILATERMFDQNKLDVRTVTMGISLLSCVSDDEINEDFIMPEAFDPRVAEVVSEAVKSHIS